MDSQGYVNMTSLLKWLNKDLRNNFDVEDVTWIVDYNDKMRFSINTTKGVKANYGHSLELPEMIMTKYQEEVTGNQRYIEHETYIKSLPQILLQGLSRMERNHIHLCKQIGGTWIRRKKRTNIVIYIDVQTARKDDLKFYSAPNDVIMCSGDVNGYIPIKYFKEIRNIHTGKQIEFNIDTPKQECKTKTLSALAQGFIPSSKTTSKEMIETDRPTRTNSLTTQDVTKYCGQAYNEIESQKNIISELHEYNSSILSKVAKKNIMHNVLSVPQHFVQINKSDEIAMRNTTNQITLDKDDRHITKVWNTQIPKVQQQRENQGLPKTTYINTSFNDDHQMGKNKMFNTTKMTTVTPQLEITLENQQQQQKSANLLTSQIINHGKDIKEIFTFFWTKDSPFSQHYITRFNVAGVTYTSSEQYIRKQYYLVIQKRQT